MRALSRLGVGLAVVSTLLLLALTAELYYIFVYKRRLRRRAAAVSDAASSPSSSSRELLQLFCFKKPPALASTYTVQQDPHATAVAVTVDDDGDDDDDDDDDETVEAQLMRLSSLIGPPRLLFTIKEETREDLESEDGRSRCGRSRSLGELLHCPGTPFLTPASSPAPPSVAATDNPLFESPMASPALAPAAVSPPPKFQFLKDAEEKLYRRALAEEAMRTRRSPQSQAVPGEDDGGYITIVVGKNNRVIPLPSPPAGGGGGH